MRKVFLLRTAGLPSSAVVPKRHHRPSSSELAPAVVSSEATAPAQYSTVGGVLTAVPSNGNSQIETLPVRGGRLSRRRFAKANTTGRSQHITQLMEKLQTRRSQQNPTSNQVSFDQLYPRQQLDILRRIYIRQKALRMSKETTHLPRFTSNLFARKYYFREEDLEETFTKGRGPGGQATNRRMQTVILKHIPSGIVVRHSRWPSLWLNRRAGRELLHLRLEEQMIGKKSLLARERRKKRLQSRNQKRRCRQLAKRGAAITELRSRSPPFAAVLCDGSTLPGFGGITSGGRHGVGASSSSSSNLRMNMDEPFWAQGDVRVHCLFNEHCTKWWELISHCCGGSDGREHIGGNGPTIMRCLLPVVDCAAYMDSVKGNGLLLADERDAYHQLVRCRECSAARDVLRRTFRCVLEVFGLVLVEAPPSTVLKEGHTGQQRFAVRKDGPCWVEHRRRMLVPPPPPPTEALTSSPCVATVPDSQWLLSPIAVKLIPRLYECLLQLRLIQEANALRRFFRTEEQRAAKANQPIPEWVGQGRRLIREVQQRNQSWSTADQIKQD